RPRAVLPRADRRVARSADGAPGEAEVLRGRHGPRVEHEPRRELPVVSGQGSRGIRSHRAGVRPRGRGRAGKHHRAAAARAIAHRPPRNEFGRDQHGGRRSMMGPDPSDGAGGANGGIQAGRYYGRPIPYLPIDGYPGKLIAIEGTDGVGRSTQIQLLREWLEVKGYGVVETGWTRSPLMQPTIEIAKSSNTLNKLTFVLLYATDFADRLEKEIIPALKAGFVVLSDRYIFTAMARAGVRGVDRQWLRNLYGFAIAPHM